MSTQLGEAFVPIRATLDKLDEDLAGARSRVEGAMSGIGQSVQAIGGLAVAGIATGVLAIGAAFVTMGGMAFNAGMVVDDAMDTIAIKTGATEEELGVLQDAFETVFTSVPTDAGTAADVIGTLNARLGLTGETLTDLATPLAQVTELIGGDAAARTELFTRVLGDWSIANEDGAATLDMMFAASQATGAELDDLMGKVVQFGSPLRLMGFSLEESVALFAKWEQEGVNAELVMGSLRVAAGEFARSNIPLRDGLMQTMDAIMGAKDESEALGIAMDVFGARAGPDMAAAIREGRFSIEDLLAVMETSEGAIMDTAAQTADFGEMFTLLKNRATLALAPIGAMMIGLANEAMPLVENAFAWFEETLMPVIEELAGIFEEFFQSVLTGEDFFGDLANLAWRLADAFGANEEQALGVYNAVVALRDTIPALIDSITQFLQPVIEAVAQFVSWKDVLIGLGIAIASVVIPIIYGLLTTLAPIIAVAVALIGAIALVRNAWENDWGGIRTAVLEAWDTNIRPALEELWQWLSVNVPAALEILRAWWVDTAWPAISVALDVAWQVISFILAAMWDSLINVIIPALVLLWDYWVNVAWPAISQALTNAWAILEPILISLRDWIINTLIPTVEELYNKWVTVWWPTISKVLTNTWTVIEGVFKELDRWINENIVPWVEYLYTQWTTVWWPAISEAVNIAWGIIEPLLTAAGEWLETNIPKAMTALQTAWDTAWGAMAPMIEPVKQAIDDIKAAAEGFWNWITSHTFEFDIHIPDLPDWAIPGSPLPIHTAWANFARDMNRMSISPRFDLSGVEAALEVNGNMGGGEAVQQDSSRKITMINPQFNGVENVPNFLGELEALAP